MANESSVVVAPDSTGKAIRNLDLYTIINGVATLVQQQVVTPATQSGQLVDLASQETLSELLAESRATRKLLEILTGTESDVNDDTPFNVPRVMAVGGLPSKANPYNPVCQVGDAFGRQIVLANAPRDMVGTQTTTISASTSETTIITGVAGAYCDVVAFIISNTSASTNTRIDVRDTTAGAILFSLQSVGGAAPIGFVLPVPWPQVAQGANWTAQCATSTTDVRVTALFIKNK
jgi:hypothetical protein